MNLQRNNHITKPYLMMQYELSDRGGVFDLIFLQGLHHQRVILPELSKQLAPVRGPPEQDLTWNNFKKSKKTDHATAVDINLIPCQRI